MTSTHPHLPAMAVLTLGTGALDAATYLGLEHVFGANMTGNLVLLGISAGTWSTAHFFGPLCALVGFVAGAALGGAMDIRAFSRPRFITAAFALSFLLLGAATAVVVLTPLTTTVIWAVTLLVGVAMGMQSVLARAVGVKDVTTVVVTSTISVLFSDHRAWRTAEGRALMANRIAAVLTMGVGAAIGALLLQVHLAVAMAFALVAMAVSYGLVLARKG